MADVAPRFHSRVLRTPRPPRASRDGGEVVLSWPGLRPLLFGEHVHVRRAELDPRAPFVIANSEMYVGPQWRQPVAGPWLVFYRLRVANACENEAPDTAAP